MSFLTPEGVQDLDSAQTQKHHEIIATIESVLAKWHYQKITTPTIEFYDSLANGLGKSLSTECVRFFDAKGHMLVLRPDFTTPIARMVCSRFRHHAKPLRLAYSGSVFRYRQHDDASDMETQQMGLELIGTAGPEADAEVVKIALACMTALGFETFSLELGHNALLDSLKPDKQEALLAKDYVTLGHIPQRGSLNLMKENAALAPLYQHLGTLPSANLAFNQGLVKDPSYYTGLVFEGYVKGIGFPVLTGGRYDRLLTKFGFDCPAIGFALNLNAIHHFLMENT